jgi:uncharacterized protein (TIGR03085 family)
MTSFARRERTALCDLMDQVGPDHPTLCAGWTTYDLAAHLWVRESDPMAGPGLVFSAFADTTEERMAGIKKRYDYPTLVGKIRNGPPTLSVFSVPLLGDRANAIEYFVHHEDVRRTDLAAVPRDLPGKDQDELWRLFRVAARGLMRSAPNGVKLRRPDGSSAHVKGGDPVVTVTGEPSELVLFGYGRGSVADVVLTGDESAVSALREASLGI